MSIAETITIYSSKNGQKNALQISTQKLREAVSQTQTYYPEEVDDSGIDFEGNGTKIVLTNLKKSRTTALAGKLKQRLARRFAVIGADKQFEVKVNGEPITISDRNYLTKAQYLWYYLRPADEDIPAQPADEYTKQCKSGVLRKSFSRSGELSIAGKPAYVYGWIATAPKPGDLDDDENINRIAIMVRGKMAKDDMLNEIGTIVQHLSARQKQLNLRAVRATMPTPHSEGKVNGGQTMNYRANPFQDYELITIDEGRLCLTQPAGYPRFEYQSKNIHDKIMMKVNSVLLAERRHFPLLLVRFPLKRSSY